MYLAERLRQVREARNLSQGDLEERTGLLRCYISRVENGHTVPSLETLEKIARACEIKLYQLFYDSENAKPPVHPPVDASDDWASHGKGLGLFVRLRKAVSRTTEEDRKLILHVAREMSSRSKKRLHAAESRKPHSPR